MVRSGDAFAACLDEARGLSLHTPHCAVDGKQAGDRELVRLLDEQAALRCVATLVARATDRLGVFAAVAEEVGRLLTRPMPPTVTATSPRSAATTSPAACGGPLPSAKPHDAGHRHPGSDERAQDPCASVSERHDWATLRPEL